MTTNILDPELLLKLASQQPEGVVPGWYVGADGRYYKSGQANVDAPDAVRQVMDSFERPYDPSAQNFDPNLISNLVWKEPVVTGSPNQTWSGSDGGTVTIPKDYDLNTGYIKGSPGDIEVRQGKRQPYTETPKQGTTPSTTAQQPSQAPTATQAQNQQPQKNDLESGYENYLKLFEKTLGDKPELDTKRRNQLAMVAGINALGQALKQVVDFTGRTKFGSPINPQQDNLTPALLGQYEKEMQDYLQRKDRYDLQKTNTMQEAMRYAYGDEQQRKASEERWKLYGEEKKDRADERASDRKFQKDLYDQKIKDEKAMYDQQVKDQAIRDEKLHGYDVAKFSAAQTAAEKAGAVAENEIKLAGENVPVIDQKTGRSLIIPKELYWDIYQKIMNNPSSELDKQMQQLEGADYEQSKNIINGLIASKFQDYYEPKYDSAGQFQGWMMIDPNAPQPAKEYKTFWDLMPGSLPASTVPNVFQRK